MLADHMPVQALDIRRDDRRVAVQHLHAFIAIEVALRDGRIVAVHAVNPKRDRYDIERRLLDEARPQLEVAGELQRKIEYPADLVPQIAPPESAILHDPAARRQAQAAHVLA